MVSVDTQDTFGFVLEQHKDKAEGEQPTLLFRFVSYRDFKRIDRLFVESDNAKSAEELDAKRTEGILTALVGWRNFSVPYDPSKLEDVLSLADIIEIRERLLESIALGELEKKRLLRASRSNTAQSVSEPKGPKIAENAPVSTP